VCGMWNVWGERKRSLGITGVT